MNNTTRRDFLKGAGSVFFGSGLLGSFSNCNSSYASGEMNRPNIIFIMTDDHAAHALSCYGSKINTTPNLDRIAKDGMRFEKCFCTNSICAPSRAVILTGKYSHINGKYDNKKANPFDGSQETFPKLLRSSGYQTAMIGKWHLLSEPTGFDYWNVLPGKGKYHNPVLIEMGKRKKHKGYVTDIITDLSIDWLKGRNGEKPFCLMYHHKAPHRNWQPDKKYAEAFKDKKFSYPETFDDDYSTRSLASRQQKMTIEKHFLNPKDTKVSPPEGLKGQELKKWKYQRYMQDYLACVASVDENVGRLLDYLDESGFSKNTVVIYTSDQGFYLGDHGWYDKRFMYEESLRMPLLVRSPNMIKKGVVSDKIVLNLDFGPTMLDLAGANVPSDMQGESFKAILENRQPKKWRESMYYHYYEYPGPHSVKRHYGVRTMRYKLIHFYYDIDAWELFDLKKDPRELNNVYDDPGYSSVVKKMKKELSRLQAKYGDTEIPRGKKMPYQVTK